MKCREYVSLTISVFSGEQSCLVFCFVVDCVCLPGPITFLATQGFTVFVSGRPQEISTLMGEGAHRGGAGTLYSAFQLLNPL